MMDFLQWGGAACVIASYYFIVTRPKLGVYLSILGCSLAGVWAYLLTPTAYGVLTIEVFVTIMGLRNLWKLK